MAHQLKDSLEKQGFTYFNLSWIMAPPKLQGVEVGTQLGEVRRAAYPGLGPLQGLSFSWPLTSPGNLVAEESGEESYSHTAAPSPHDKFRWVWGKIRNSNFY